MQRALLHLIKIKKEAYKEKGNYIKTHSKKGKPVVRQTKPISTCLIESRREGNQANVDSPNPTLGILVPLSINMSDQKIHTTNVS
jgi:hypothetical protein